MVEKKLMLRVIDGGRPSSVDDVKPKRMKPKEESFDSVRSQYRKILASRYVERMDDEIKPRLDWKDVVKDKKLLVEQAIVDGTSTKEVQYAMNELKSKFATIRKDAALYLAYVANDSEIFGYENSRRMINVLLENGSEESRDALRCLGFCTQDIAKLKFCEPIEREAILDKVLKDKKED